MIGRISKYHYILLLSLVLSIIAGTIVTAETNGFSFNSTDYSSPSTGYSPTPDIMAIPTIEPTVFAPTTTVAEQTIQQPINTETPGEPSPTTIETTLPTIVPTMTAEPEVSNSPTVNESIFSMTKTQGEISVQGTPDYTWSDPPLNNSPDNPYYYDNKGWVIDESGHEWIMDLNTSHNTGSGVTLSGNTFSGFGSSFAILINAPDVIFDGMGAILNGDGKTEYGILVNNQNPGSYNSFSSDPANSLGGINVKNVTLIGFTQAGIFFNNVIGTLPGPGTIPSSITNVSANYNVGTGPQEGIGIFLQNSNGIEVNSSTAIGNHEAGFVLAGSNNILTGNNGGGFVIRGSDNILTGNNATRNSGGFALDGGSNNTLIGNTATECLSGGFHFVYSNNNKIINNSAIANQGEGTGGFWLAFSNNNEITGNTAIGNRLHGFNLDWGSNNNTLIGNSASENQWRGFFLGVDSHNNTLTGNSATGNKWDGIGISYSNNNTLISNSATGNQRDGISLYEGSNNNILIGNLANENKRNGFTILSFNNNEIIGNSATDNQLDGFSLADSNGNKITGNSAIGNQRNGFTISSFINNEIIGNSATGNQGDGLFLINSDSNILTGNIIQNNNGSGIMLSNSNSSTIFNNYFSNTNNVKIYNSKSTIWNSSKIIGPNIIGGPFTGGNYWASPNGTGFSQSNSDRGDGFTIIAYNISDNNIDYLPLVIWVSPTITPSTTTPTTQPTTYNPTVQPTSTSDPDDTKNQPLLSYLISSTLPSQLKPGETFSGVITIRNTGKRPWTSEGVNFGLRPFGDALKFGLGDIMIPEGMRIESGEEFSFPVTITAPSTPGPYDLQFRMFLLLPSKNGKSEGTPFGDIMSILIDVTQNAKKTESLKKNLGSVGSAVSSVVTHNDVVSGVTLPRWTPTPVWKPTPYSLNFNAKPVMTITRVTGNSFMEEFNTGNLTWKPTSIVYRPTTVSRPSAVMTRIMYSS